jgi:hypothetical protein
MLDMFVTLMQFYYVFIVIFFPTLLQLFFNFAKNLGSRLVIGLSN